MFSREYLRVPTRPPAMATSLPSAGARVCHANATDLERPGRGPCGAPEARLPRVTPKQPVELHVISDSTGETAVRLVHALEAQFPEQEFEEIRHPRVETVDDLHLALNRAKGRPAVIVYTLVHPELREADAHALPPLQAPLLRPARPPDRRGRRCRGRRRAR